MDRFLERVRTTQLPSWLEWAISWSMVLGFAVKYVADNWRHRYNMERLRKHPEQWCRVVPLASLPQTEQQRNTSPTETLQELHQLLLRENGQKKEGDSTVEFTNEYVTKTLQSSLKARLLASAAMIPYPGNRKQNDKADKSFSKLTLQLQTLWPTLLSFPEEKQNTVSSHKDCKIALIVPAYREDPKQLNFVLQTAFEHCQSPNQVNLVVVDAGGTKGGGDLTWSAVHQKLGVSTNDNSKKVPTAAGDKQSAESTTKPKNGNNSKRCWGQVQVVRYRGSGGRGGCMNHGAAAADDCPVLTFLHSDTLLPRNWDDEIRTCLLTEQPTVHMCAFGMGIDQTKRGLDGGANVACRHYFPPGLCGAEWQGRIRSNFCCIPYGDSALSFRASTFHYLGGFPDQPLMEDFAVVNLFRQRAGIFPDRERIGILPSNIHCSPRRWQKYGVHYVALANWTYIGRYRNGATAEEMYQMYYQQPPPSAVAAAAGETGMDKKRR